MRRPELDGLRGLAVLLVVVHHTGLLGERSAAGPVGVTVFFALSGYLITSLLLTEVAASGRVRLGRFYARRARRLLPALVFLLAVVGGLGWVAWRSELWTLLYAGNLPMAAGYSLGGLSHTWSLALEEQFYLAWPLALVALSSRWGRRGVAWGAGLGAGASVVARIVLWAAGASQARLYFGPDVRADALLIGCLAAAVGLRVAVPGWLLLGGLVALVATPYAAQGVALPTVTAALAVAVIASPARVLTAWPLRYAGTRSYALYLWHFPLIFLLAPTLGLPHAAAVAVAVGLAWALAELSWWAVERPLQRLGADSVHPELGGVGRTGHHVEGYATALVGGQLDIVTGG